MCVLVAGMRGADRPSTMPLSDEPRRAPLSATTPSTNPRVISAEVVIIGAGPCGLFQVFELGLLGISAHVVDSLQHPGGQCAELYPDRDRSTTSPRCRCAAPRALVDRLLQQIKPFQPQLHLGHEVVAFARAEDGRFQLAASAGMHFDAGAVVIAGGVGSRFQPRRSRIEKGAEVFEGNAIQYRVKSAGELAGSAWLFLAAATHARSTGRSSCCRAPRRARIVHRRAEFRAAPASLARMQEQVAAGACALLRSAAAVADRRRRIAAQRQHQGPARARSRQLAADSGTGIFRLASRKLGPIADWGLSLEKEGAHGRRREIPGTSLPGVFAVGDINTAYPGKKKLILSGFHRSRAGGCVRHPTSPVSAEEAVSAVHHH